MGNQTSETHDRFNNPTGVRQKYHFDDAAGLGLPQPFPLHDHHVEGPSKVLLTVSFMNIHARLHPISSTC